MSNISILRPLERLKRLLSVDKKDITQVYIYALFNGLVNLSLPLGIQAIINLIQGGEMSTSWFLLVIFVIAGIALTGVLQMIQLRIVENISQKIFTRSSFEFAFRFPRIKYKELYNYYAPELANRFFDTLTLQKGLPKILIDFSLSVFQIIAGLLVLSLYHPFFIIFGVILIALIYSIMVITGPKGLNTSLQESKYKYDVAHWLEEIARTKLSFKLINEPEISLDNTDKKVVKYINSRESHFKVLIRQFMYLIGFKVLIAAGLLIIGSLLVFNQEMNIGQFVAAEIIIIIIINSVEKLIKSLDSVYDVLTALEKLGHVTDMEIDDETGLSFQDDCESIETQVRDLSFYYPNSTKKILKNMNFIVPPNESLCIMGTSGSGKSTLLQVLSGISEATEGVIEFNGMSINAMNSKSVQENIGYSLSNNQIFLGTLLENITMGRPNISIKDVNKAIDIVDLKGYSTSLSEGLNTFLDPEGRRIPRSVANKIIIARAIVSKPKLLILEDPLDYIAQDEKIEIIKRLVDKSNGWSIILTTVDNLWTNYIPNLMILKDGKIISNTLNNK
jgi:ABC-type bacteriocin/lantibiotic exporter with double-glycine peptidase domain